jgi:ribose/xylose/arabinose/galactoside ABC-type transport system permease subunit
MPLQTSAVPKKDQAPHPRGKVSVGQLVLSEYFALVLCIIYFLIMWPIVPEIGSPGVWKDILSDMIPLLVVAIGQTFVLIAAEIDLSETSIIAFASVFGASIMTSNGGYLANHPLAVPAAILGFLLLGIAIGAFNGGCVARLGMPSFIVTLATRMFFAGSALWYTTFHTKSSSISGLPAGFVAIGQGEWQGIPYSLVIAIGMALLAHWVLTRTVYGQWLIAIGINRQTARISGVPVERVIFFAFVISGLCAAVGSILYTGRLQTGTPILGERILLDIIGAVVIGGTSLFGGKGKILWTVFGVLFLMLVDTTLKILGASLFTIYMIKGGVILFAAVMDSVRTLLLARR